MLLYNTNFWMALDLLWKCLHRFVVHHKYFCSTNYCEWQRYISVISLRVMSAAVDSVLPITVVNWNTDKKVAAKIFFCYYYYHLTRRATVIDSGVSYFWQPLPQILLPIHTDMLMSMLYKTVFIVQFFNAKMNIIIVKALMKFLILLMILRV